MTVRVGIKRRWGLLPSCVDLPVLGQQSPESYVGLVVVGLLGPVVALLTYFSVGLTSTIQDRTTDRQPATAPGPKLRLNKYIDVWKAGATYLRYA